MKNAPRRTAGARKRPRDFLRRSRKADRLLSVRKLSKVRRDFSTS
jgi:hypothetical protein